MLKPLHYSHCKDKSMLLKLLEYHWAEDLDEALILLARTDTKTVPLAGGTYLLGHKDEEIQAMVDLPDLELAYIEADAPSTNAQTLVRIVPITTLPPLAISP